MTEFLAFMCLACGQAEVKAPDAEEVLKLALKQRQAITKFAGTFKFSLEKNDAKNTSLGYAFRTWIDGNKQRQDLLNAGDTLNVECRNCEQEGQFIRFHSVESPKRIVSIEYGTMPRGDKKGDHNYGNLIFTDPRQLWACRLPPVASSTRTSSIRTRRVRPNASDS